MAVYGLCTIAHGLCITAFVLCTEVCVFCTEVYVLCIVIFVIFIVNFVLYIVIFVICIVNFVLCIVVYVLCIVIIVLCIKVYVLYTVTCVNQPINLPITIGKTNKPQTPSPLHRFLTSSQGTIKALKGTKYKFSTKSKVRCTFLSFYTTIATERAVRCT